MRDLFARRELVYAVYKERSFSKAAQKLYISQPSLSALIKKTEEEVGLPLFDRSCKPVRLTEAGREYIRAAEEMQRAGKAFGEYVDAVNGLHAGTLSIGSNQLFSSLVLPEYVSRFIRKYPGVRLDLLDANSAVLESRIASGKLDLIVDNRPLDPVHFERRRLRTEYLILAVPAAFKSNAAAAEYRLTYDDVLCDRHAAPGVRLAPLELFAGDPFILMTRDNDTRQRTADIFREAGFEPNVILEIDRLVTLYNFISMGTAAAVVSDTLIKKLPQGAENTLFYALPEKYARREVYIHCKRSRYRSRAMESFMELLAGDE